VTGSEKILNQEESKIITLTCQPEKWRPIWRPAMPRAQGAQECIPGEAGQNSRSILPVKPV
jgi:hypothetical protein